MTDGIINKGVKASAQEAVRVTEDQVLVEQFRARIQALKNKKREAMESRREALLAEEAFKEAQAKFDVLADQVKADFQKALEDEEISKTTFDEMLKQMNGQA